MKERILYEDNHLLVVNKTSGVLVQGDKTGDRVITDIYKYYLKEKYNKPGNVFLQPAHRLDRPTSGCLILTRTSKATTRVTKLFRDNEVKKCYLVMSHGVTKERKGELIHYLKKDGSRNITKAYLEPGTNRKKAHLHYELIHSENDRHLYLVSPTTGRSHQIRVQMALIGAPIMGDVKYGGKKHNDERAILLHCWEMTFLHPTKKELMTVSCEPQWLPGNVNLSSDYS